MKRILIIIVMFLVSFVGFSQDYPRFLIQGSDTVGIVISIEQAQKIDKDYTLFEIIKRYNIKSDSLQNYYVSIVNKMNEEITQLKIKDDELKAITTDQKTIINNLKLKVNNYEKDIANLQEQSSNKDQIIENDKKEIKKLKREKFLGFSVGGGGLLAAILLLILK